MALPNISTATLGGATLGGAAGRLDELAGGSAANLKDGDPAKTLAIIEAAENQVLEARTRAGAFEKYTVESSQRLLGRMEESISEAASLIRDTDVAREASNLIRSQILADSAISSLLITGQRRGLIGRLFGTT